MAKKKGLKNFKVVSYWDKGIRVTKSKTSASKIASTLGVKKEVIETFIDKHGLELAIERFNQELTKKRKDRAQKRAIKKERRKLKREQSCGSTTSILAF